MSASDLTNQVDISQDQNKQTQRASSGCYQFFGIKSHLHHFYEYNNESEINDSEVNDTTRLFLSPTKKTKRCSPIIWKILLWFGVNALVFGAILILVSHFTARHPIMHSATADNRFAVIDKRATRINRALDILGTVGIVSFCCAGVLIVIAVLLPTYFNEFCFENRDIDSASTPENYTRLNSDDESTIEHRIPATHLVHGVQPQKNANDSLVSRVAEVTS